MGPDAHVLYLNWDGFSYDYYQEAHHRGMVPVIDDLIKKGTFFSNTWCGVPAITNPMQTAIASGAYSLATGNVKIHYDKTRKVVVQQRRENNAENIVQALTRQGVSVASVHHFTFEENGCSCLDPARPFIYTEGANYQDRFDELLNLYSGKKVQINGERRNVVLSPRFVAVYFDDLDTIGHNNGKLVRKATTEPERFNHVLDRLRLMDTALGNFLKNMQNLSLYRDMSVFLITDHGMTPFAFGDDSSFARNDLFESFNHFSLQVELLSAGESPQAGTDVVLCTAGLSMLVSWISEKAISRTEEVLAFLSQKPYIGKLMTADELIKEGSFPFCDVYISPRPPLIFKNAPEAIGAGHDSLDGSSRRIFSLAWGKGIQQGLNIGRRVQNIDFAPTMTAILGVNPPGQSVGKVIEECLIQ